MRLPQAMGWICEIAAAGLSHLGDKRLRIAERRDRRRHGGRGTRSGTPPFLLGWILEGPLGSSAETTWTGRRGSGKRRHRRQKTPHVL
jgi:hypothetical protein